MKRNPIASLLFACGEEDGIESDNGTTEGTRSVFVAEPSYHPKVKAQNGATNSFHTNLGGKFQVDATIEIHRAKQ